MALQGPFVRLVYEHHPRDLTQNGGFYYLVARGGARENVGRSVNQGTGHLVYKRDYNFVRIYGEQYPLGVVNEWTRKSDFNRWIESVIYYSFVRTSIGGVPCCWVLKRVSSLHAPEALPVGLQAFFPPENVATWILIRHGYRVWPILVVGHLMFNDKWTDFCNVHGLRIGCRVVFGCEKRWVFNTFLFNENGREMTYDWSDPAEALQQLHPVPDNLHTACLPSIIEYQASLFRFLCEFTTVDSLHATFHHFLHEYMENINVEAVVFKAANRSWTTEVEDNGLFNCVAFANLCEDLFLQPFDYLMVALTFDETARIVIFRSNDGSEKVLDDWEFHQV